ncbi:MAG TPA: rod shape-determining protein RodA [Jatrophihabitans sp.]|jgi:rod shape determining protein RodA
MTQLLARDPRAPFELPGPLREAGRVRRLGYDWLLVGVALALALIGAVLVWAATRDTERAAGNDPNGYLYRHLVNLAITGFLMIAASRMDARMLRRSGPFAYLAGVFGLLLVLAAGVTINGAHAWIRLGGGFEVQPSEFMKLGLIIGMAVLFVQRGRDRGDAPPTTADVLLALGLVAVPLLLIMLQPDLGSAMVVAAAAFGVLIAAGVRARWTIGLLVVAVIAAIVVVKMGLLADYQLARFKSFTDPMHDPQGAAYNINQAHIAIANGGLFGTGLFNGPQTNGGYVPEQRTDFVFSVMGEEFGLVGGAVLILLFALLCWRGLVIARTADRTGQLVAVGIVCWFAFQAFQNIGMNLGLMPVTGLPLPFVSYGGSSMFAQGLAIGVLQAVRRRNLPAD